MMQDYASGTRGLVRIYANVSSIAQFLPADLHGFIETYPDVQLQLEERISTAILKGVAETLQTLAALRISALGNKT